MITVRILDLIESGDALAAMLQTLRLTRTLENCHPICLSVHAMGRECDKLANDLANGVEL
jgi:hypothetical protein